jgi:hypothetical protein
VSCDGVAVALLKHRLCTTTPPPTYEVIHLLWTTSCSCYSLDSRRNDHRPNASPRSVAMHSEGRWKTAPMKRGRFNAHRERKTDALLLATLCGHKTRQHQRTRTSVQNTIEKNKKQEKKASCGMESLYKAQGSPFFSLFILGHGGESRYQYVVHAKILLPWMIRTKLVFLAIDITKADGGVSSKAQREKKQSKTTPQPFFSRVKL